MTLSHVITLDPNNVQATFFRKAAGVHRFAFNWAKATWEAWRKEGRKVDIGDIRKEFTRVKKEYPWLDETHRDAYSQGIYDFGVAMQNFFSKKAKYPKWKKKGKDTPSFYMACDKMKVEGKTVCLPKVGPIRMRQELRFTGKIMGARVRLHGGRWFISINVAVPSGYRREQVEFPRPRIGVDLGERMSVTCSDSKTFQSPKPLAGVQRRLKGLNRKLARQEAGSNRRKRTVLLLQKQHARVSNIRNDFLHKTTSTLCRENQTVVVEDLHVKGMVKNRKRARRTSDEAYGEFRRQMAYKMPLHGGTLVVADRFFPSSKTCSACGGKQEIGAAKAWVCGGCGIRHDRDQNAALNLERYSPRGAGSEARRELVSPRRTRPQRQGSLKREACSLRGDL